MKKSIIYELDNNKIEINFPTPNELIEWGSKNNISDCEKEYFTYLNYFIAKPSDFASHLDEVDIDFTKLSNYELFYLMLQAVKNDDSIRQFFNISIKINNKKIEKFEAYCNDKTGEIVIGDIDNDIYFTKEIYEIVRKIIAYEYGYLIEEKKFVSEDAKKLFVKKQKLDCLKRKYEGWKCFLHDVLHYLYTNIKSIEDIAEFMNTPVSDSFKEYIKKKKKECDDKLNDAIKSLSGNDKDIEN